MKTPCAVALLQITLALGCGSASQRVGITSVLDEAQGNELAAIIRYRNQRLEVTGTIVMTGVQRSDRLVAETAPVGWGWGVTTLSTQTDPIPYAQIADIDGRTDGGAICYFAPRDLEKVATLVRGARAAFVGTFGEFFHGPAGRGIVLYYCRIL